MSGSGVKAKGKMIATYPYKDARGKLLFETVRFEPKDFRQRRPDPKNPGKWIWDLNGVHRVLYRLPELLKTDHTSTVFIVEGEKDVDNIRALGLTATCNSCGAGKWHTTDDSPLNGRRVAILPDNDEEGKKHSQDIATALCSRAFEVRIVHLPTSVKDISDWIENRNDRNPAKSCLALLNMVRHTPIYDASTAPVKIYKKKAPPIPKIIREGERALLLTSIAGSMRNRGMSREAIYAGLRVTNYEQCSPPLPDDEVRRIAYSIGSYPFPDVDRAILTRLTDAGAGEFFAGLFGANVRFDNLRKRWLIWGSHCWVEDKNNQIVKKLCIEAARERERRGASLDASTEKNALFKFAVRSENRAGIENTIVLAQCQQGILDSGKDWDANPYLLGVQNGVVDLKTGKLRPGSQEDRVSRQSDIPFDCEAKAPRWKRFLREIFSENGELIQFIQRAVGHSLTGDINEQCLFFLFGAGANGKSTFLRVLQYILGDYSYSLPFCVFEVNYSGSSTEIAHLDRVRLAIVSEVKSNSQLNTERIKVLSGGDKVNARYLYQEPIEFTPMCKMWFIGNDKPVVKDDTDAFWRRLYLIPFLRQFKGEDADLDLYEKLRAEAQGILAWAVRGCLLWQRNRLSPPNCVKNAVQQYRQENDLLAEFIQQCCVLKDSLETHTRKLYAKYSWWAIQQHFSIKETLTSKMFGRLMGKKFGKKFKSDGGYYLGIGLRVKKKE
jgi:putative DNA primase/helicase